MTIRKLAVLGIVSLVINRSGKDILVHTQPRIAHISHRVLALFVLISILVVIGCGGGGAQSSSSGPVTYTIGGTISGLSGSGLVLQDNGGNNLSVSAGATIFTFTTAIASGGAYSVTVLTQPSSPAQTCMVTSGSGTASANVTNVQVVCTTTTYTIGGTISGLYGSGLVLQNNGGNNLTLGSGATTFTFTTAIASGGAYNVTVLTQPSSPAETCMVASGSGTASANVTNVAVACTIPLTILTTILPLGAVNVAYVSTRLAASGGVGPFTWETINGTVLPSGLALTTNGAITNAPSPQVAGTTNFTVQVTDSEIPPVSQQANLSITVVTPSDACTVITNNNPGILLGSYAFLLQGFQGGTAEGTPVAMAGSFTANGTGTITGGEEDLNTSTAPQHLTITGGSYAVNMSGQGCIQFSYSAGMTTGAVFHLALSLVLNGSSVATHGRINEFDDYSGTGTHAVGAIRLQNATEFSTASLAPAFALGEDGLDSSGGHFGAAGSFSINNSTGVISNFEEDIDDAGSIATILPNQVTASLASTATTGTTGRELLTVTVSGGSPSHVASYIVNKNELFLVQIDQLSSANILLSARAIATASSFTNSSLSGNYMFQLTGIDTVNSNGVCPSPTPPCSYLNAGIVNANPSTLALNGTVYQSENGASASSSITTTYSVNTGTGRVQLGSSGLVLYIAAPVTGTDATDSIAAFLVGSGTPLNSNSGDPTALFGFAEAQGNGPFSVPSSPPQYVFATGNPGENGVSFIVGTGSFSSGSVTVNRDSSTPGGGLVINSPVSFTFTVNSNGTVTGTTGGAALEGVTNGTLLLFFATAGLPAFIRLFEP